MTQLNIDTGVEEFSINGRGTLRFNPGDPNLYRRFVAVGDRLTALEAELTAREGEGDALALLGEYDAKLKALLGEVFGPGNDFDAALEGVNLAGVASNGKRVIENLLDALAPILQEGAERTARQAAAQATAEADAARAARGV